MTTTPSKRRSSKAPVRQSRSPRGSASGPLAPRVSASNSAPRGHRALRERARLLWADADRASKRSSLDAVATTALGTARGLVSRHPAKVAGGVLVVAGLCVLGQAIWRRGTAGAH